MPLTETNRLYEVLIRFNADGSYSAHQRYLREIRDESGVIAATEGPATALVAGDLQAVIGEAFIAVTAERDGLTTEVAALTAERDALAAQFTIDRG